MKKGLKKVPRYSDELKKRVVEEIVLGNISISDALIKYRIGHNSSIYRWIKRFGKFVKDKKKLSLPVMKEKEKSETGLDLRIEELLKIKINLELELRQALLECKANKILVDIAKEEFKIDLRKKHGVKQ